MLFGEMEKKTEKDDLIFLLNKPIKEGFVKIQMTEHVEQELRKHFREYDKWKKKKKLK